MVREFHPIKLLGTLYTIKLLLTDCLVHMGNIFSDLQGAWPTLRSVHRP